ncbi:hypothetical protein FA15DRAFT_669939 [Coprinopsis marcescibilis]|uniref:Integral membrane protein n=1 Tax=Coprinopsis marcescibilis TaxID=230819 RepID=A0A5C3KU65_COPMA|nr:hypothetical protein FA15DRAFT_669939 [Coprinopsis marcescibilis]
MRPRVLTWNEALFVTGVAIAEAILYLRIYAISGRNRKFMIYLIVQYIVLHVAIYGVYAKFALHQSFAQSPFPTVIGCLPVPPKIEGVNLNVVLSAMFILILVDEIIIMIMSLAIGLMKYRSLKSPLIKIFYRDGTFYFVMLAGISLGNILFNLVGAPEYRFFIVVFQRVMHSILSCRMLLHMKAYAQGARGASGHNSDVLSAEPGFLQRNKRPPPPGAFNQGIHVYEAYRGTPLTSFTDNIEMSTETGRSKISDIHGHKV